MIILTAAFKAAKGKEEELEKALAALVPLTAKEEGVVEYRLHRSMDAPGSFLFYERFRDQETFDLHMQTPHLTALPANLEGLLAEPLVVTRLECIVGIPE